MATVKLKYVYPDKDRQRRCRWLLRLPGRRAVTLKGAYGSPEFMASYQAAVAEAAPAERKGIGIPRERSLAALALGYLASGVFKGHADETQRSQRGIINALVEKHGDKPWCGPSGIRQEHVQAMVNAKAETPSAARNLLFVMRALGEHAIDIGWRKKGDNPALGVTRPKIKGKGFRTWSEEHCAKFEATHLLGTRARFAYELLSCTPLRRSDIVRVGRQHVRKLDQPISVGPITITHELDLGHQKKTDEEVGGLLILPWLQAAIDAVPTDNLTFIVAKGGKPLTKESFGNWFHECCLEAGLLPEVVDASGRPKGLASHGLRKRMAKRLAQFGCSDEWIAAVLGHADTRQVKVYTKGANKKRMARSALVTMLEAEQRRTSDLHTPDQISHTPPELLGNKGQ